MSESDNILNEKLTEINKSIYFNKHFDKFINNDVIVRTYFDINLRDLKAKYNNIFDNYVKKSGIKLVNNDDETIKQAKIILWDYYRLKQSKGQGKKTMKAFKILECEEVENIAKDTSLKISERAEQIAKIIKQTEKPLSLYQIEQYIYRNYSDYKYDKPKKVEIVKPKRTKFDTLQNDEFNDIINNNEPNEAYKLIIKHNVNNELGLTNQQIKQYVYRQKYKNAN